MFKTEETTIKALEPIFEDVKSYHNKAEVAEKNIYRDGTAYSTKVLYSYRTPVASLVDGEFYITANEKHLTPTSIRHIKEFMRQNGLVSKFQKLTKQFILDTQTRADISALTVTHL
ncbi:hypothetical protein LP032_111 [Listeria phage LP-032]|uniref:DUF8033 domain-containing protein n=4 Tax=Homburgvirus TaxID=1921125 RepID=S4UAB3_9CAUD|nr:hypothetical protein P70_0074 [Listeria phage P70]YP_008240526.1 hypothetical protein LP037_047 [Listeria phage LP-037]YP_009044139.1 hypothetical protein LP026_054 [Listeria phage LP-026]AHL18960.1 hypothetical protein LP032_111 [Listeria phage LP-032]AFQ96263.1 hypothetical protein P70_0074 [Listeria phage P70]AGI11663.1 hypothetical protein LP037_047 [Listeria phage LP-037]AHN84748.1 hypothetical protein LP026_054 [Listeria phage LP-026]